MISCAKSTGKYKINLSQIIFQRKNIFRTPLTVSRGIERPLLKPAVLGKPFTIRRWLLRQIFLGSKTQKKTFEIRTETIKFSPMTDGVCFLRYRHKMTDKPAGLMLIGYRPTFSRKNNKNSDLLEMYDSFSKATRTARYTFCSSQCVHVRETPVGSGFNWIYAS